MEMIQMNGKVICPTCGKTVRAGKFCEECGARMPLPRPAPADPTSAADPAQSGAPVDDNGLTLLVDFCRRTMGTIGGDGYQEHVLYRNADGEYEVHYYWNDAVHNAYRASKELLDEAMTFIRAQRFADFEGRQGIGMMGGMVILKFRDGERMIRVTSDNLDMEHQTAMYQVCGILSKCTTEENLL